MENLVKSCTTSRDCDNENFQCVGKACRPKLSIKPEVTAKNVSRRFPLASLANFTSTVRFILHYETLNSRGKETTFYRFQSPTVIYDDSPAVVKTKNVLKLGEERSKFKVSKCSDPKQLVGPVLRKLLSCLFLKAQ